ncbi:MAG: heparinase II/III family protein [Pseudomonadota bacterium]
MNSLANRLAVRAAGRHGVTGFTSQPQPKSLGEAARGRQVIAGNLLFAGQLVELNGKSPWDVAPPSADFSAALHGFAWLDDLAVIGTAEAQRIAQDWTHDWIRRYGKRAGPGWMPWLVGRRQIRWITHAIALMNGADGDQTRAMIDTMGRQARYVQRNWTRTRPGFARFEALTGYVQSATALTGMERHLPAALSDLAEVLQRDIDADGAVPSRNPEELLEIFALLTWTTEVMRDTGRKPDPALDASIARIAPVLRSLRLADGGLARFHGGGRGRPGLLDLALRQSRLRPAMSDGQAMGYGRLQSGAVTIIADCAPPQLGPGSGRAHASSLAIQMTSGRDPVLVSCGAGMRLGPEWRRAGRATPSHSTLVLAGYSSARMARKGEALVEGPKSVTCHVQRAGGATTLAMTHDGWRATHGLTHERTLTLAEDGRLVRGEDGLSALAGEDRQVFDRVLRHTDDASLAFQLHFHLHPDVRPVLDMGGQAVSLTLKSGEVWVFRQMLADGDSAAELSISPSVYLDSRHVTPRATKQIVLSGRVSGYGGAVHWSLACPVARVRRRHQAPMIL